MGEDTPLGLRNQAAPITELGGSPPLWLHLDYYDRFRFLVRSRAGPQLFRRSPVQREVKSYRTYQEQIDLLVARGMVIGDYDEAFHALQTINYYRLSGYWYPFRIDKNGERLREFIAGTKLEDVLALYQFDARLRTAVMASLSPIELAVRALLGHGLGRIDPLCHLKPNLLGPVARTGAKYAQTGKYLVNS